MTKPLSTSNLIFIISVFWVFFANFAFFENVIQVYPLNAKNSLFVLSLTVLLGSLSILFFGLICYQKTVKPVLILFLLLSSSAAYFMDTYNIIIDTVMIENILHTDIDEALDLLSIKQGIYFIFLGLIPAFWVYKIPLKKQTFKQAIISKLKLVTMALIGLMAIIVIFGNFYASFLREHKHLRMYGNPTYYIYSNIKYINHFFKNKNIPLKQIGLDAKVIKTSPHRKLVIFVVGETARADHFSLNGYLRKTNPYLEKEAVLSFQNVWSCGTSTAYSLPCMFSIYSRDNYDKARVKSTENVLDILQRSGINVFWLDNNSNSKGVADRIPFKSTKIKNNHQRCEEECRDKQMLEDLPQYISEHPQGDIFIVLHQMGNHGPAYYKRYPKDFERFKPVCKTNQLEQCNQQEIKNAYDNALLYTDYFLSQTIQFLKKYTPEFETTFLYVSDHGESLGENNFYLHGLPYLFAPDAQKHVPMILWSGQNKHKINNLNAELSHDHLFHSILGLMSIQTTVYDPKMDIFQNNE